MTTAGSGRPVRRVRAYTACALALAALLVMLLATRELVAPYRYTQPLEQGFLTALVGGVLFVAALAVSPPVPATMPFALRAQALSDCWQATGIQRQFKRAAVPVAVVGIAAVTEANSGIVGIEGLQSLSHHAQFVLLVACCVLPVWGMSDRPLPRLRWRDLSAARRLECIGLVLLTIIALALRLYNLEVVRAFIDETNFIRPMQLFTFTPNVPLLQPQSTIAAFPRLYSYFQWLAYQVADSGLIALRAPAAFFGALTVPALYLLGKQVFNWRVGMIAAMLLTTFPLYVQWSRLGMNNTADPLFGVLMVLLLVRGARRGGSWHFAAAGVCFGLTHYFYEGGRLLFTGIVLFWFLYFMLLTAWRGLPRRYVATFLLTALLIATPIYVTLAAMDRPLTARLELTSIAPTDSGAGEFSALVQQFSIRLQLILLTFVGRPEDVIYYGGDYAYFHVYLVPVLLLGVAALARRWRTPQGTLLLVWILGTIVPVALLISGPGASARFLVAFPALILVCALGMTDLLRLVWWQWQRAALVTAITVTAIICVLDVVYYVSIHTTRLTQQIYAIRPEQVVVFHARTHPAGTHIHYISRRKPTLRGDVELMVQMLNAGVQGFSPSVDIQDAGYIRAMPFDPDAVFYLDVGDKYTHVLLEKKFVLSPPIRWPQPDNPPGQAFVAYRPLALRHATPPVRALGLLR